MAQEGSAFKGKRNKLDGYWFRKDACLYNGNPYMPWGLSHKIGQNIIQRDRNRTRRTEKGYSSFTIYCGCFPGSETKDSLAKALLWPSS